MQANLRMVLDCFAPASKRTSRRTWIRKTYSDPYHYFLVFRDLTHLPHYVRVMPGSGQIYRSETFLLITFDFLFSRKEMVEGSL